MKLVKMYIALGILYACPGLAMEWHYPGNEQTPPPVPPRTSSLPGYQPGKLPPQKPLPALPVKPAAAPVKLSEKEEHSIQKIEEDINKIILNLVDIAQHGANIGIAVASSQGDQILGSAVTEGAPIAKDIGSTTLLIANIIKHSNRLSKATPEVRAIAQERIHEIMHSENFVEALERFEKYVKNGSAPSIIRKPLQKLAHEIKELPNRIVNLLIKK